ncbi:MAG: enoyl-CoA hydratase/isomerase family protein [Pseudomonadota bacterium]|nr:enoyl-CoA hydratase/isomerase family protein [Pseudomonadota bacterium]
MNAGKDPDILIEKRNRCGLVTLNRPQALNALTYDMIEALERRYVEWAADPDIYAVVMRSAGGRAFCGGGDIKALYEWNRRGDMETILRLYGIEYQHNWSLDRFIKPHVALIDGIVMGGGVGISIYGTHRVAGPGYSFAMPETAIGFFPDVGATWFLSRLTGQTGMYLALTGRQVGAADAFRLGLVTHCIAPDHHDAIIEGLSEAEPVDPLLDGFHADPGRGDLETVQPLIDRIFSGASVEAILAALDAEKGDHAGWASSVAADIRTKSPTGLKVAFRQMRMGPSIGLDEALRIEYRLARRFLQGSEFYEGVRAALIDRDRKPAWNPAKLEDVSDADIDALFAPLPDGEFALANPYS